MKGHVRRLQGPADSITGSMVQLHDATRSMAGTVDTPYNTQCPLHIHMCCAATGVPCPREVPVAIEDAFRQRCGGPSEHYSTCLRTQTESLTAAMRQHYNTNCRLREIKQGSKGNEATGISQCTQLTLRQQHAVSERDATQCWVRRSSCAATEGP